MCFALEWMLKNCKRAKIDCALIKFADDSIQHSLQQLIDRNNSRLNDMMHGRGNIHEKQVVTGTDAGHSARPRRAAKLFTKLSDFGDYTDVIVDISSIPMNIYFPLLGRILHILDSEAQKGSSYLPNLHVVATENPQIDRCIYKLDLPDEATYLYGFTGNIDLESEARKPLVWIPILGEGRYKKKQIRRINDHISPKEICPVLPSPSACPRRGDDIMLEYRDLLDRLRVEMTNIIYGSEQNPFEVYRQIHKTTRYYRDTLKPLGGSRFAISPLSSKLTSMGAFLASYEEGISNEKNVGIVYVESGGHDINYYREDMMYSCELFSMWIFGDCYDLE